MIPAAVREERRVVTTLFCDLVGFTDMSEGADPEDVDALLQEYAALARATIESHGGSVEKYIGDAVVGVFGVPVVHEDDAERAVRAAIALLQRLDAVGLTRPDGSPLRARCGVNTGEVLARLEVDPLCGRGFVTGDAVNTAARLQAAAPPMGVVVGELTHRLTAGVIDYEDLPPVSVKGKRAPVKVWRALQSMARTGLRTSLLSSTRCLERERELQALRDALDRAASTRELETVLIVGEPGIGKSRLVLEFARSLDQGAGMVTWRQGRCPPYGEGVAFWPLVEIVKAHCGILDTDDATVAEAKLERMLGEGPDRIWFLQRLRALLGLEATRSGVEENFVAWSRLIESICSTRPAVLVIEDLHWADTSMLAFLEHLLAHRSGIPAVLVATARPELMSRHDGLLTGRGAHVSRLTLPVLSQDATTALAGALLDADPTGQVARRVTEVAGGNPLFVEQCARLLMEEDWLARPDGDPHLTPGAPLPVPETVQAVLAARLDTLPRGQKALLCDASVIGEVFWEGAVVALSGRDRSDVAAVMAALMDRDLVRAARHSSVDGETEYLFWHALTRDVAYGQLPRRVRARNHEAAARWVQEATGRAATGSAEIIAHHYVTALELARAVGDEHHVDSLVGPTLQSLRLAGERALRLDATTARRHLDRALALAEPDSLERLRLLPPLAEALFLTRRLREAADVLEEAVSGLEAAGDHRLAAVAMCRLAHTLPRLGEPDRGLTRRAVGLLADDGPSVEKAEVWAMHALSLAIENEDPGEVLEAAAVAIELCGLLDLPEPAVALHCRAEARLSLGDPDGFEDYDRALDAARDQGLGRERATIAGNRSSAVLALRGPRAALNATVLAMEFAGRHGLETYVMNGRTQSVACLREAGEWDQALMEAAVLLPAARERDSVADVLYVESVRVCILAERGDGAQVEGTLPWLVESARDSVGYLRGTTLMAAALAWLRIGRPENALSLLVECAESPASVVSNHEFVPGAVRTALSCGDRRLAGAFLACITPASPYPRLPLVRNVVRSVEALLAEADGEVEAAAAAFSAAAADWRAFDVPYEEAHALFGQGRCLAELGGAEEAARSAREAHSMFAGLKARPALEEVERLLLSLQST